MNNPLVSVVIPTYCRPIFLKKALDSVLNQTYKNIEIFITDNSPDIETKKMMQEYLDKYSNIIYEHHPEYEGAVTNWNRAIAYDNPNSEYVNWLMDDDIFMPNKIEYMLDKFMKYPNLSLVTSYRQCIDIDGNLLPDTQDTMPISDKDVIIRGKYIGKIMLQRIINFIGEPTTVLIKKSAMINGKIGRENVDNKYRISDFPTWLKCLKNGDLYYAVTPLSKFRQHQGQSYHKIETILACLMAWGIELESAWKEKTFFENEDEFSIAAIQWIKQVENAINISKKQRYFDNIVLTDMIHQSLKISDLLAKKSYIRKCACCGNQLKNFYHYLIII